MKNDILGVKIDDLSFSEAMHKIADFLNSDNPAQICTVNPEFIMTAQKDKEFRTIINQADLDNLLPIKFQVFDLLFKDGKSYMDKN